LKRTKIIAIVGIVLSLSLIITLVLLNVRPYLKVSQVVANSAKYDNQEIQVIGIVQDFSGGNFNLTENNDKIMIDVSYVSVPSELTNGLQIVVVGQFNSSLVIVATLILTQCS